jgi:hypothetical protein
MPILRSPFATSVVEVSEDAVDRYLAAGWTAAESEAPAKSAKVGEWRAYAVSQGMSHDDAESATKADLVEQYG